MRRLPLRILAGTLCRGATVVAAVASLSSTCLAKMTLVKDPLSLGFAPIAFISPANIKAQIIEEAQRKALIARFCADVAAKYRGYHWGDDACGKIPWKADLTSKGGHPLIYAEFGRGDETTLLLGGVHPDEVTPVHLAFRTASYLADHPEALDSGLRVVIAPLVNPDGFLITAPTRTNSNGIDLNRNFFTMDWYGKAKQLWTDVRERSPKHFPGYFPNSEIETIFQIQLIDDYRPDKILSVHAPLGWLDYDGPGDGRPRRPLTASEVRAKRLVKAIAENAKNYKVVDYTFFPGSLGNYAGNERRIPTVTLELKSTSPKMVEAYWQQFLPGLMQSFRYPYRLNLEREDGHNATPFSAEYAQRPKRTI